jgi:hypothetical protein
VSLDVSCKRVIILAVTDRGTIVQAVLGGKGVPGIDESIVNQVTEGKEEGSLGTV